MKDDIILGLPFFEEFVVVYNYTRGIVQFAVSPNAEAGTSIRENPNWADYIKHSNGWEIFWGVLGLVLFVVILAICCVYLCRCYSQRKLEDGADAIAYNQNEEHNLIRAETRSFH